MARSPAAFSRTPRLSLSFLVLYASALLALLAHTVSAYQVPVSDADALRQTCSGMWAGKNTSIDLTFKPNSTGIVATIFYEWSDFDRLGKYGPDKDVFGYSLKSYVCTPLAVRQALCEDTDLGNFIVDGSAPSVFKQRMDFGTGNAQEQVVSYRVNSTGYYCVGATAVPFTSRGVHASFQGLVNFHNAFKGELPGGEYPKVGFYFGLTSVYILLGLGWGYLCIKHKAELLPIQHFISGLSVLLIVEQMITWLYYSYLNSHVIEYWRLASLNGNAGETWTARALLVLEGLLDSTRNSASFFLLLIVSMGYGIVRPQLEPRTMFKVKCLTAVHLICGWLYSVGIVLLSIEAGGTWVFLFIFPLAFSLTTFMSWTLNSLNATISHLTARKQSFKLAFFNRLWRILVIAIVIIFAFFVLSTISFSNAGTENYPSETWRYRWFLLDGWTSCLYLGVFVAIAWIFRPTGYNMRLSMSDELATGDDPEGGDMELGGAYAGFEQHGDDSDDEDGGKKTRTTGTDPGPQPPNGGPSSSTAGPPAYEADPNGGVGEESVVMFSLGDEEEEDQSMSSAGGRSSSRPGHRPMDTHHGNESEETLMAGTDKDTKQD